MRAGMWLFMWSVAVLVLVRPSVSKPLPDPSSSSLMTHFENCVDADLMMIEELKEQLLERINFESVENKLHLSFGLLQDDWHRLLLLESKLPPKSPLKTKLVRAFRLLITALYQSHVPPLNADQEPVLEDLQPSLDDFSTDVFKLTTHGKSDAVDNGLEAFNPSDEEKLIEEETQDVSVTDKNVQEEFIEKVTEAAEDETVSYYTTTVEPYHDRFILKPAKDKVQVTDGIYGSHRGVTEGSHEGSKGTSNKSNEGPTNNPTDTYETEIQPANKEPSNVTEIKESNRPSELLFDMLSSTTEGYNGTESGETEGSIPSTHNLDRNLTETYSVLKSKGSEDLEVDNEATFDERSSTPIIVTQSVFEEPIPTTTMKSHSIHLGQSKAGDNRVNFESVTSTQSSVRTEKQQQSTETVVNDNQTTLNQDDLKNSIFQTDAYPTSTKNPFLKDKSLYINTLRSDLYESTPKAENVFNETGTSLESSKGAINKQTHIQRINQPDNRTPTNSLSPTTVAFEYSDSRVIEDTTPLKGFAGSDSFVGESTTAPNNEETTIIIGTFPIDHDDDEITTTQLISLNVNNPNSTNKINDVEGLHSRSVTLEPEIVNTNTENPSEMLNQPKNNQSSTNYHTFSTTESETIFPASTEDEQVYVTNDFDDFEHSRFNNEDKYDHNSDNTTGVNEDMNILDDSKEIVTETKDPTTEYGTENVSNDKFPNIPETIVNVSGETTKGGDTIHNDQISSPTDEEEDNYSTNEDVPKTLDDNLDKGQENQNKSEKVYENHPNTGLETFDIQQTEEVVIGETTDEPFEPHENVDKPEETQEPEVNYDDENKSKPVEEDGHYNSREIYDMHKTTGEAEETQELPAEINDTNQSTHGSEETTKNSVTMYNTQRYTADVTNYSSETVDKEGKKYEASDSVDETPNTTEETVVTQKYTETIHENPYFTSKIDNVSTISADDDKHENSGQTDEPQNNIYETNGTKTGLNKQEEDYSENVKPTLKPLVIEDRNQFSNNDHFTHTLNSEETTIQPNENNANSDDPSTTLPPQEYTTKQMDKELIKPTQVTPIIEPLQNEPSETDVTHKTQDSFPPTDRINAIKTVPELQKVTEYFRRFTMRPPKLPRTTSTTEKINTLQLFTDRQFNFQEYQPKLRNDCPNSNDCVKVEHLQYENPPGTENKKRGLVSAPHGTSKLPTFDPSKFWEKVRALRKKPNLYFK